MGRDWLRVAVCQCVLLFRGKCTVSLLNELEDIHTYLDNEDTFFFTMVYDPNQRTLLVDKGEIRVGTDYQAEIPPFVDPGEAGRTWASDLSLDPLPNKRA